MQTKIIVEALTYFELYLFKLAIDSLMDIKMSSYNSSTSDELHPRGFLKREHKGSLKRSKIVINTFKL